MNPLLGRVRRTLRALEPRNLLHILRSVDTDYLAHERGLLARHPLARDEWGLIFPFGMGDLYVASAFAGRVRAHHGGSGVTVFVKPQYAYIPTLFAGVSRVVPVETVDLQRLHQHEIFAPGRLLTVFPLHPFREVIGYKGISFLDYYCLFLQLPLGTAPEAPRPQTAAELEQARHLLARHGLPQGRTVILAPRAVSTAEVPAAFWSELAARLVARGDVVVTNAPAQEQAVPGTRALDIPIEQVIAVSQLAGSVVSARSGLCELLAHAPCRLTVVYPDEATNPRPRLTRGFGLGASGWRPDAREVWYDARQPGRALDEALSG
jgi:ADP-heptose:LPS heptosyltransferase